MKALSMVLILFLREKRKSRCRLPLSLHFERIELKDEFEGTPAYAYQELEKEIARVNVEMNDLDKEAGEMLSDRAAQLVAAKNRLGRIVQ